MRVSIGLIILLVALVGALAVGRQMDSTNVSQESKKDEPQVNSQAKDKEPKVKPKRDIKLTITPIRYSEQVFDYAPTDRYKAGEPIRVQVEMTSIMAQATEVIIGNHFYQNRLRLTKDGQPVLYRGDLPKKLKKMDESPAYFGSMMAYELQPNQTIKIGMITLNDWYGSLDPGHYELTLRHRFMGKEQPADSNTTTFEIVP